MEIQIEDTKYGIVLGFGNVMKIQGMFASSMTQEAAAALSEIDDGATMDDIPDEYKDSVMSNLEMMPAVLALTVRTVNGRTISNIENWIDEKLHPGHGMKLFEKVVEHINELVLPKV